MPLSRRFAAAIIPLALAACTTDPETGQQHISRAGGGAALGAGAGALLGAIVGGRHDRTETLVGAGIGALAGGAVGTYMDRQEAKLRAETQGTGVQVVRDGDELHLEMPSGITFASNEYAIQPQFQPTLDKVAQTLAGYPQTFIDVYGHTDSTGGDAINVPLSQNRARAVADYLSARGVIPARLGVRGMGSSTPIASNDTPDGRQANRRVEIRIVPVTSDS